MNRSLKLSILMALALGSTQAAAVELGQAHIKSFLGQPLLVDIPVKQATPAELQGLSAELASNDAFAKVGATRPTIPLQFNVVDVNGQKVIRITSATAVDDPYLDLFVKVNTGTGSSVSEVTVLLDPVAKTTAAASSAPIRRHTASAGGTSAASSAATTPSAAPTHREAPAGLKNGEYTVEKGQTLSHVAVATAPAGVDKDQMMLALKVANPDAFYRDNINALKAGAILRVPSKDDAASVAAADAAAQVRQQEADWRNGTVGAAPTAVATGGTRANASVAPTATSNADRLALVPPGGEGQSAGAGSNGKGADNAKIRSELQRSQETLSSLEQQSDELKSRLKDLEDLNTKNQHLLSLKDNEIADLQKKLADARKSAGLPLAPAAPLASAIPTPAAQPSAVAAPTHPVAATTPALASAASAAKTATAPVGSASAPHTAAITTPVTSPAAKPTVRPPHHVPVTAPAPAEEPWYMQTWAWAVGGGVIVLGLLALFGRRGKSSGGAAKKTARLEPVASKGSLADRFGTVDPDHPDSDPDQDQLLDQLAENPDDIGLHLELVSLYYTRRDVEHFEAAAEAMHAHITEADQPEWQDVVHMGRDLAPGHPLFAEADIPQATHDERSPLHQFDLDSYGNNNETVVAKAPAPSQAKVSEYHFDFDLTPHQREATASPSQATTAKQPEQEPVSTWRFDEAAEEHEASHTDNNADFGELHDDPIDTKLDLARAYLDMGDPDGARAMLDEVMQEGTQMQKDTAKTLMAKIR